MKVIKQLLMSNGFTPNYVNESVKLFLSKKHDVKDVKPVVHTCEKRTVFIRLPTLPSADSWYRKPSPRLCPGLY